jgi:hypothetical protein
MVEATGAAFLGALPLEEKWERSMHWRNMTVFGEN